MTRDEQRRAPESREHDFIIPLPAQLPVQVAAGEGAYVWDHRGKRYLDMYGGHAAAITGHCHPRVVAAIKEQAERLIFYSPFLGSHLRGEAAEALLSVAPSHLTRAFFVNSGAEANEGALKMARRFTDRTDVVAMDGSFHGRTLAALSVTGARNNRSSFPQMVPGSRFVPYGDLDALEQILDHRVAAVILEPVQSLGGAVAPEPGFLEAVIELAHSNGSLVIFDEIQTAPGRVGAWTAAELYDVKPDFITMAKGIASGIPMSVVLIADDVAQDLRPGEHGTTFGGGPMACAACIATFDVLRDEELPLNAARVGRYFKERLGQVTGVERVTGEGLLLGVHLRCEARPVRDELVNRGILGGGSANPNVIRFLPSLIIRPEHVDQLAEALTQVMDERGVAGGLIASS